MTNPSNVPMLPAPPERFYQVWLKALTRPNEQTFAELAESPNASPGKAYLWVFLAALIGSLVSLVMAAIIYFAVNEQSDQVSNLLLSPISGGPVSAGLSVLGLMISAGLVQWVAGKFKGTGTFSKLVYVFGAILAPITLVSSLALGLWPVSMLLFIYGFVLGVIAVKGVNKFNWGEAIGSMLIPLVILIFCGWLAFYLSWVMIGSQIAM